MKSERRNSLKELPFSLRMIVIVTAITLVAATTYFFATSRSRSQDKMFLAKFKQLQGYDRDPIVQFFCDNGQDAVVFLAREMKSNNSSIRIKAVKTLRQMGPRFTASSVGVGALCAALNDSDMTVRSIAQGALGDLGPQAKAAVPLLIKCVSGSADINGVWALGRIGPDANEALPILETKMRQATGRERVYAAGAVWEIGGENTEAKTVVKKALEDPDAHIRIDAHNVLEESPEMK
jgi:hypothetical protein